MPVIYWMSNLMLSFMFAWVKLMLMLLFVIYQDDRWIVHGQSHLYHMYHTLYRLVGAGGHGKQMEGITLLVHVCIRKPCPLPPKLIF